MRYKKVDILGKTYKLKFIKDSKFEESEFGIMDPEKMEILINNEKSDEYQKDTFLHETIHAIDVDMGLGLSERQVRNLGCALYQVLKTNTSIRRWLFKNGILDRE